MENRSNVEMTLRQKCLILLYSVSLAIQEATPRGGACETKGRHKRRPRA